MIRSRAHDKTHLYGETNFAMPNVKEEKQNVNKRIKRTFQLLLESARKITTELGALFIRPWEALTFRTSGEQEARFEPSLVLFIWLQCTLFCEIIHPQIQFGTVWYSYNILKHWSLRNSYEISHGQKMKFHDAKWRTVLSDPGNRKENSGKYQG